MSGDPDAAKIVNLRYFADVIAEMTGLSERELLNRQWEISKVSPE